MVEDGAGRNTFETLANRPASETREKIICREGNLRGRMIFMEQKFYVFHSLALKNAAILGV